MEKKKLHRVVGILILIAVVIVALPLVTGKADLPLNRTLSVDAPPFPESGPEADKTPDSASSAGSAPVPASQPEPAPAPAMKPPFSESGATSDNVAPDVSAPPSVTPPVAEPVKEASPQASASEPTIVTVTPAAVAATETAVPQSHLKTASSAAWAVQMGNFHNHNNAVRLANRLRMAGYKAYTRQVVSRTGHISTRVYVGSELAEVSAKKLSQKIHSHLNLEGVVVTVDPLSV